jgi:hypothetical protein
MSNNIGGFGVPELQNFCDIDNKASAWKHWLSVVAWNYKDYFFRVIVQAMIMDQVQRIIASQIY